MPQIIVVAEHPEGASETLRERICPIVCQSEHSANQLLERIRWAVADADELERLSRRGPHCDASSYADRLEVGQSEADEYDLAYDRRSARVLTTAS